MAAGLIGCESAPALQQSASAYTRGQALYQRDCVGCHSERGSGDAFAAVPALAGQRFEYLRDQIEKFSTDERHSTVMRWAFNRAATKPRQSAEDLAAYLSQLPMQRFAESNPRFHDEGEKDYVAQCAACHAMDARGNPAGTVPSLRLADSSIEHFDRKLQYVAANWVLDPHPCIGIREIARVPRMFEVIEQLRRIHSTLPIMFP